MQEVVNRKSTSKQNKPFPSLGLRKNCVIRNEKDNGNAQLLIVLIVRRRHNFMLSQDPDVQGFQKG